MPAIETPYEFRPLTHDDLPMVSGWLRTPEVTRWWGDPKDEEQLIAEDLREPLMRQWIVEHIGHPFGYVQVYAAPSWPQSHLAGLPDGSVVIDTFIGEPNMIGRGHGRRFLHIFAEMMLAEGASAVAIDPVSSNHRARRAFASAGFVKEREFDTEDGQVVVMLYRNSAATTKALGSFRTL